MLHVIHILEALLPVLYGVTFVLYLQHFLRKQDRGNAFIGTPILQGTLVAHLTYLVMRGVEFHHFPVSSRAEFLSLVALCVGLVYAFAEMRNREPHTGPFFVSIVFVFQLFGSLLMDDSTQHPLLHENPIYGIHVIFTVFGFASLAVSALYALMYIMLARQLKSRHLGMLFQRLPPLMTLENMSKLATLCGIVLLGVGLLLGHFVAFYIFDSLNILDPKILITDIAWLAYVVAFIVVKVRGLSGLRMGYVSLFGYLAFVVSMIAVNVLFSSFHSFS